MSSFTFDVGAGLPALIALLLTAVCANAIQLSIVEQLKAIGFAGLRQDVACVTWALDLYSTVPIWFLAPSLVIVEQGWPSWVVMAVIGVAMLICYRIHLYVLNTSHILEHTRKRILWWPVATFANLAVLLGLTLFEAVKFNAAPAICAK